MTRQQFIDMIVVEQKPLRRFLRGLCGGDGFRADDIAQEALLKAYLSFEGYEGRARFSTWLFRIAWNCWYDHMKASSKEAEWPSADDPGTSAAVASVEDGDVPIDRKYEHEHLYMAIRGLSPPERAVVLLFYMEERSIKEIASVMSMPSGTVLSHLSRARRHLKKLM